MTKLVINGGAPLGGTIRVNGSKNASLPIMAAALMIDGPVIVGEVPRLTDVETMRRVLHALGVRSAWIEPQTALPFSGTGKRALRLELTSEENSEFIEDRSVDIRASLCTLGPLLARRGRARIPMPGGCDLGPRPIDLHIKGLEALGAEIKVDKGYICATARRLKGAHIYLAGSRGPTVLGTANVMMAAVLATGTTVIEHAACEPEIQDLAHFLNGCGASISGVGTSTIVIEGLGKRRRRPLRGCYHTVIPDRIEAGTFACAAAIMGGDVVLEGVRCDHMRALLDTMRSAGVRFDVESGPKATERAGSGAAMSQSELPPSGAWRAEKLRVRRKGRLKPVDFDARPYPGLPTDMQPQLVAVLSIAHGTSVATDHVHPERFNQVTELNRLGADVAHGPSPGQALVRGPAQLTGATVTARDLRGGASLILGGLAAEGQTSVLGMHHVDRGYERIEERLASLGAELRRVELEVAGDQEKPTLRAAS